MDTRAAGTARRRDRIFCERSLRRSGARRASVNDDVRAVVCRGARVDLVVPKLHSVRAEVLLLVGERDTAHIAASRGAFWVLPDSARLEVVPNAGHLLDDPIALDHVAAEAERWFGETLDTWQAAGYDDPRRVLDSRPVTSST